MLSRGDFMTAEHPPQLPLVPTLPGTVLAGADGFGLQFGIQTRQPVPLIEGRRQHRLAALTHDDSVVGKIVSVPVIHQLK